jgi:hypothetical protein
MYLRPCKRAKRKKSHVYWELVESVRTERGPRQRVVAYLGDMAEPGRLGVKRAADGKGFQSELFGEPVEPEWVEVDAKRIRLENARLFGGVWLGLELARKMGLDEFLERALPTGRAGAPWSLSALALVLLRLVEPSSGLSVADGLYEKTALPHLLGVPSERMNDDRLYRTLDRLLPLKTELEKHLRERVGELFGIEYDLLLYDVTSTFFEGQARGNEKASFGYSRDHRGDCRQVCVALVVTRSGMPLAVPECDVGRQRIFARSVTQEAICARSEQKTYAHLRCSTGTGFG